MCYYKLNTCRNSTCHITHVCMIGARLRSGKQLEVKMTGGGQSGKKSKGSQSDVHQTDPIDTGDIENRPGSSGNANPEHTEESLTKDEMVRLLQDRGFSTTQVEIFLATFDGDKPSQMIHSSQAIRQIIALELQGVKDDMRREIESELRQNLHSGSHVTLDNSDEDSSPDTGINGANGGANLFSFEKGRKDNRGRSKSNKTRNQKVRSYLHDHRILDSSEEEVDEVDALSFQRRKNHKIPNTYKFAGGDKDDVHSFIRNMEKQQKQARMSDADMAMIMPYHLTGKALTWYLQRSDEDQENWVSLKQNLLRMFSRVKGEFQIHSELANLTQGSMSIMDFSFKVAEIASRCDAPDDKKLVTFVSGLTDDDVKIHLSKERPSCFDAAVVAALDYEYEHRNDSKRALIQKLDALTLDVHKHHKEVKELSKGKQEPTSSPQSQNKQPDYTALLCSIQQQLNQQQQQLMAQANSQQGAMIASITPSTPTPAQNTTSDSTCHKCGQSGHWRRDCRSNRPRSDNNRANKYCEHCQMKGHLQSDCTWFKKGVACPYCTKCKRKGHDTSECRKHPN